MMVGHVAVQVMRVVVFDRYGTVLHKFGCSRHLEFPNGVVANDQDEIFISDNRSHCVKVWLDCVVDGRLINSNSI